MGIGLESWFMNFSQFSRKSQTPESLATVPNPYLEYALWGFFKGAEVASILGGCIAHPLYRIYLKRSLTPENTTPNSPKIIRAKCRKLQGRFLLAGMSLGPILAYLHSLNEGTTFTEVQKKCYQIRCDKEGMTIDRCALVCGLVGWYWKRFQGAVDGINIGLGYAVLDNKVLSKFGASVLQDAIKPEDRYENVQDAQANRSKLTKFLTELDKKDKV